MRKILGIAFAAALVSVPVGLATPPANHQPNPRSLTAPGSGKHGAKPCPKPPRRGVAYIIRGVVTADVAPGATSFVVDVTSVNAHAKKALAGPTARGGGAYDAMLTVEIDRCTFITKNRSHHRRGPASLDAGDRVIIGWKAARKLSFVQLGAADRIVDRGKAPTA